MKNVFKVLCIIAFVAIIGFSMAACGDDGGGGGGGDSGLSGTTWTYTESGGSATLTFIDSSKVKMGTFNGTYTFNGSSGTINWDDGDRYTFTVNGNQLTMEGYTFTKTGGGNSGGNTPSGSGGTFTITDIPAKFNGKYAILRSSQPVNLLGSQSKPSASNTSTGCLISNGRVSMPLWIHNSSYSMVERYTGNDRFGTYDTVSVSLYNSSAGTGNVAVGQYSSFTFSNGSATKSWNEVSWYEY